MQSHICEHWMHSALIKNVNAYVCAVSQCVCTVLYYHIIIRNTLKYGLKVTGLWVWSQMYLLIFIR